MGRGLVIRYEDGYDWRVVSEGTTELGLERCIKKLPSLWFHLKSVKIVETFGVWSILVRKDLLDLKELVVDDSRSRNKVNRK